MSEAQRVSGLRANVKLHMPGAYWHKIADRSTLGRPDITVTWRGRTSWLEAKSIETLARAVTGDDVVSRVMRDKVQLSNMLSAYHASGERAFYAVYVLDRRGRRVELWVPHYDHGLTVRFSQMRSCTHAFTHDLVIARLLAQHTDGWRQP